MKKILRLSKILRTRDVKALQDYIFDGTVSSPPDVLAVNEWELDGGTDTDRPDSSTALAGCQRQYGILNNNNNNNNKNNNKQKTDRPDSSTPLAGCQRQCISGSIVYFLYRLPPSMWNPYQQ